MNCVWKNSPDYKLFQSVIPVLVMMYLFGVCSAYQVEGIDVDNLNKSKNLTTASNLEESQSEQTVQSETAKMKFSVQPLVMEAENIINFNISWTDTLPESEQIGQIEIHMRDILCKKYKGINTNTISVNKESNKYVIIPGNKQSFEIIPSCVYTITITARVVNSYSFYKEEFNYTVPDCVDGLCNCSMFHPINNTFKVKQTAEEDFQVEWQLLPMKNISVYKLSFHLANGTHHVPTDYIDLASIVSNDTDFWAGNYSLHIDEEIFTQGRNELLATFTTNLIDCEFRYDVHFNATKLFNTKDERISYILLFLFMMVAAIVVIIICFWRYKKNDIRKFILRNAQEDARSIYRPIPSIRQQESNPYYVDKEIVDKCTDEFEFPTSGLRLFNNIGGGAFGEVFLGQAFAIGGTKGYSNVAVKCLRGGAPPEEVDDFLTEINILKRIPRHQHIVALFGCCTLKEPYMMIMEFIPCGDLRKYLLKLRNEWKNRKNRLNSIDSPSILSTSSNGGDCAYIMQPSIPDNSWQILNNSVSTTISMADSDVPSVATGYTTVSTAMSMSTSTYVPVPLHLILDSSELQNFSVQIARGMEHLEKIPITHRDLAARNILINEHKMLKISDFGMSRSGPYVNRYLKKIPLRWNALEAIDRQFYDSKSDVWSFAVVLWEIGTLGAFPYQPIADDLLFHALRNGHRLERPEVCTDELYTIMLRCWSEDPQLRPSFKELVELLDDSKSSRRAYIDFRDINTSYVFPPVKGRRDSRQDAPLIREEPEEELRAIVEEKEELLVVQEKT